MQQYYIKFTAMDTEIEIEGTGNTDLIKWEDEIVNWFEQYENICSRFRSNSGLSILNEQPTNTVIQIHPILFNVLKKALDYANRTDFLFNPFIGSAIKALGYNNTFTKINEREDWQIEDCQFEWNCHEPMVFLPVINGVIKKVNHEIDLGGIAKGWSVDKVASIVKDIGLQSGIVNAGGDLFVWGEKSRTIGIQHPDPKHSEKDIVQFEICNGGIATSNKLYRSWYANGERVHHILNGKKGASTQSNIVQATAISTNTVEADVIAKLLCMQDSEDAITWLTKYFPHAGCILIKNDGQVVISKSVKNYVTRVVM